MDLINHVANVPIAAGPYSQAIKHGGLLFCSGQIPIVPSAGKIEASDVEGQTRQVLANLSALLASQGVAMKNVIKETVFLVNMADFAKVNAIYEEAFRGHKPARSAVAVSGLPMGALIEIEVIATLRD